MKTKNCVVEKCDRQVFVIKHMLCRVHYERYRHKGNVGEGIIKSSRKIKPYGEKESC